MNAVEVYARAGRGDFSDVAQMLAELKADDTASSLAWSMALQARNALIGTRPSPLDLDRFASFCACPDTLPIALRASHDELIRATIVPDAPALKAIIRILAPLRSESQQRHIDAVLGLARSWDRWLSRDGDPLVELEEAKRAAKESQEPSILVQCTSLEALILLSQGEVKAALLQARRASRMARSEGLLAPEYLAHLVLARARRYAGTSHLATRILSALSSVVPPWWKPAVAWEQIFAGAEPGPGHPDSADAPYTWALASLQAAKVGDRAGVAASFKKLQRLPEPYRVDVKALALGLNVDDGAPIDSPLGQWRWGHDDSTPPALSGLCVPDVDDEGSSVAGAFVLCTPGAPARRVLRHALRSNDASVEANALAHERTNTALAVLAFREFMQDAELFASVYGFRYLPDQHGSALRQLVRRMRTKVGDQATIVREKEGYSLAVRKPLAVPDPRCAPGVEELVLRFIASRGGRANARDCGQALGVGLRTVQGILGDLVEEGVCHVARSGRALDYLLEDTTFANPTLMRLVPKGR